MHIHNRPSKLRVVNACAGNSSITNFPQSAPFPPALDPHYAEYIQHMSQQQVYPGAPLSTLTHIERASTAGAEAASQSSNGKVRVNRTNEISVLPLSLYSMLSVHNMQYCHSQHAISVVGLVVE